MPYWRPPSDESGERSRGTPWGGSEEAGEGNSVGFAGHGGEVAEAFMAYQRAVGTWTMSRDDSGCSMRSFDFILPLNVSRLAFCSSREV